MSALEFPALHSSIGLLPHSSEVADGDYRHRPFPYNSLYTLTMPPLFELKAAGVRPNNVTLRVDRS